MTEEKGENPMNITQLKGKQEIIAAEVHNAWWREKEKQGFHPPVRCPKARPLPAIGEEEARELYFEKHCDKCHTDMYPYEELSEEIKEYDRVTVRAVLDAIEKIGSFK